MLAWGNEGEKQDAGRGAESKIGGNDGRWEMTNNAGMLLKNRAIEQAVGSITHRRAEHAAGALVQSRDRGSEKKVKKTPNEANMLNGINNLAQKTNPNEANKSFVLGVPP